MLVRLTKCTVKGHHSAPKMKKNRQDDKSGSYMCAKGTQNLFFAFVWLLNNLHLYYYIVEKLKYLYWQGESPS